jgi:hypothetical protein
MTVIFMSDGGEEGALGTGGGAGDPTEAGGSVGGTGHDGGVGAALVAAGGGGALVSNPTCLISDPLLAAADFSGSLGRAVTMGGSLPGSSVTGGAAGFFASLVGSGAMGGGGVSPWAIARPQSRSLHARTMPNSTSSAPIAIQPYLLGRVTIRAPLDYVGCKTVLL